MPPPGQPSNQPSQHGGPPHSGPSSGPGGPPPGASPGGPSSGPSSDYNHRPPPPGAVPSPPNQQSKQKLVTFFFRKLSSLKIFVHLQTCLIFITRILGASVAPISLMSLLTKSAQNL